MRDAASPPASLTNADFDQIAAIARARDPAALWAALCQFLTSITRYCSATMWFDLTDLTSSGECLAVFTAPECGGSTRDRRLRREYPQVARFLAARPGLPVFRGSEVTSCGGLGESADRRSFVGLALWDGPDVRALLALYRSEDQGEITESEFAALAKVHPLLEVLTLRFMAARRPEIRPILSRLTPAEREVAILAARGLDNPEIGLRLRCARSTVKAHLAHIYAKLGVRNRTELASRL